MDKWVVEATQDCFGVIIYDTQRSMLAYGADSSIAQLLLQGGEKEEWNMIAL